MGPWKKFLLKKQTLGEQMEEVHPLAKYEEGVVDEETALVVYEQAKKVEDSVVEETKDIIAEDSEEQTIKEEENIAEETDENLMRTLECLNV